MNGWLIELFAHKTLTQALWGILAMTAPFWGIMLLPIRARWVKLLASPYCGPVLLSFVLLYFFYLALSVGPPELPQGFDYRNSKAFVAHPMVLLLLVCNIQILHLFLGTIIFREAKKRKMKVQAELLLTWVLGPVGWLCFVLRTQLFHK